jgi:DNA-binding transcriptional LysR family regulator
MRRLCLSGSGLGRVGQFHVQQDLEAGSLVAVLEDFNPGDNELIHAVYAGHEHLAARVRAFIDFLADRLVSEDVGRNDPDSQITDVSGSAASLLTIG